MGWKENGASFLIKRENLIMKVISPCECFGLFTALNARKNVNGLERNFAPTLKVV